jgi:hypothetical protein
VPRAKARAYSLTLYLTKHISERDVRVIQVALSLNYQEDNLMLNKKLMVVAVAGLFSTGAMAAGKTMSEAAVGVPSCSTVNAELLLRFSRQPRTELPATRRSE